MNPTSNKSDFEDLTTNLKDLAYSYLEKYSPSKQQLKIYLLKKYLTKIKGTTSKKEVSIVTNIPGTTTDTISSILDIEGYKFTFVDTAGIRKHKNKIEEIGIKKTKEIILKSSLSLVFLEKNEKNNYVKIKDKFFVRSKLDKKRIIKAEKDIINYFSLSKKKCLKLYFNR